MAFVNHEARAIALARIRALGLATKTRDNHYPIFMRKFNPTTDAIYIRPGKLGDAERDIFSRMEQPDVIGQVVSPWSEFRHIAISQATLISESVMEYIPDLIYHFSSLRELLVVVNAPQELECAKEHDDDQVQLAWQFATVPGDAFCWDKSRQKFTICDESMRCNDEVVSALVETEAVTKAFIECNVGTSNFTIRLVVALRV